MEGQQETSFDKPYIHFSSEKLSRKTSICILTFTSIHKRHFLWTRLLTSETLRRYVLHVLYNDNLTKYLKKIILKNVQFCVLLSKYLK